MSQKNRHHGRVQYKNAETRKPKTMEMPTISYAKRMLTAVFALLEKALKNIPDKTIRRLD